MKGDVHTLQLVVFFFYWYIWQWWRCTQRLGCKEMTYWCGLIDTQVLQSHVCNEQTRLSSRRRPSRPKETQSVKIYTLMCKWTVSLMQLLPNRPLSSILLSWSCFIYQVADLIDKAYWHDSPQLSNTAALWRKKSDRSVCWNKFCVFYYLNRHFSIFPVVYTPSCQQTMKFNSTHLSELIWIILSLDSRWTSRQILETVFHLWSGCSCKANVDPQMLKCQNMCM